MPYVQTGRGDLARTIELLWGTRDRSRGPKPTMTVDHLVDAAIALADENGLEGLSMRRVADRLGVGTMSLYRYVPGKAELIDVMVDRVCAETERPWRRPRGWRRRLEQIAGANRRMLERHPWLLNVSTVHPPLGPGVLAKYDYELGAVEGLGLTDVEMDSVLGLVLGYAHHAAGAAAEASQVRAGGTDDEWWTAVAPALEKVFDPTRFPLAARVGTAAADHYGGALDAAYAFEFGLQRVLDGIDVLIRSRSAVEI